MTQYLTRRSLRKKGFILAYCSRGYSPLQWGKNGDWSQKLVSDINWQSGRRKWRGKSWGLLHRSWSTSSKTLSPKGSTGFQNSTTTWKKVFKLMSQWDFTFKPQQFSVIMEQHPKNNRNRGYRDGSAVKRTCNSCRGPRLASQYPYGTL